MKNLPFRFIFILFFIVIVKTIPGQTLELIVETGHSKPVGAIAFNADGKLVASSGGNGIKLWEIETGRELKSIAVGSIVQSLALSPDNKLIAFASDETVTLLNIITGIEIKAFSCNPFCSQIAFSPDGKLLASGHLDKSITIWNVVTGQPIKFINSKRELPPASKANIDKKEDVRDYRHAISSLAFTPDGKILASFNNDGELKLWDISTGQELKSKEFFGTNIDLFFTKTGQLLGFRFRKDFIDLFDPFTNQVIKAFSCNEGYCSIALSPDSQNIAISNERVIEIYKIQTGELVNILKPHSKGVGEKAFFPQSNTLAFVADNDIKLLNLDLMNGVKTLKAHSSWINSIAFSPDGKVLASGGIDYVIKLWDVITGQESKTLVGHSEVITGVSFSSDGKILVSVDASGLVKFWETSTGKEIREINTKIDPILEILLSPDSKTLAFETLSGIVKLWDISTGQATTFDLSIESQFRNLPDWVSKGLGVNDHAIKIINRLWIGGSDDQIAEIDFEILARFIAIDENDWAVITPDGRFDASEGALRLMHYAYGLEVINLEQLKEMYYEPGLLQKLLGFSKEPLRSIVPLKDVKLYPEIVEQKFDENTGRLSIKLKNRGGGIGKTEVFVNDKIVVADARDGRLKQNPNVAPNEIVNLSVELPASSFVKGKENQIKIVTSNYLKEIGKGNIQSRGTEIVYRDKRTEEFVLPTLYAIVGGVSDYEGEQIDLRFAAKDAEDFASALRLGARRLFCDKANPECLDKVQVRTLSTQRQSPDEQPTKENFRRAFAEIAAKAKPEDIIVIYLAGHGVSLGAGTDTYFYLTKEARSASKEDLAKTFQTVAISSQELTDWLTQTEWVKGEKGIKALKQVLILDTCAAGTAAAQLALTTKRDLSGDQIRAIEFLKDKTGTFVLMGSTADAPSYEASQYGQGLLTYSLLQAMKGAELDKGEFIDVRKLFTYAEQTVPRLATNIGGVQKPIVSAPLGKTFVIGQMTEAEKQKIKLPQPKPIILRPLIGMLPRNNDPLNLTAALRKALDAESSYEVVRQRGGKEPILIYIDDDSFPDAIQISGTYTIVGDTVKVKVYLFKGDKEIAELEEITASKNEINEKLLETVRKAMTNLK